MVLIGLGLVGWMLVAFISRVTNVVLVICLGLVFQMLLSPLVDRLSRWWPRGWAILAVVAGSVLMVVGGGGAMVALLTHQIGGLVNRLPKDFNVLSGQAPGLLQWLNHLGIKISLPAIESRVLGQIGVASTFVLHRIVSIVTHLVGSVVEAAVTIFITIYLLVDAERIHGAIVRLVPPAQREGLLAIEHTLGRVVGGYVRGQLLLSSIVGMAFGLGSWGIGLPYPLVVGILSAVMELIPLLGPILGAVLPVLLALMNAHPFIRVPEVLALLGLVHLIESQLLGPRIIRTQVGLHPVLSVVALMIGADLWGVWGALVAVPSAGILVAAWVAGVRVWRDKVVIPASQTNGSELALPPRGTTSAE
jgi:predicted PurR-regulated permease PerM